MSHEIVNFDVNNTISLEYLNNVKEEFQDEYYLDNKVCVSEATININKTELNDYMRYEKIRKYEMPPLDDIKTDLPFEVNNTVSNNITIDDGICPGEIQIKFCNELLLCNHCHEVYQDYCTKCKVLVHILNERHSYDTHNRVRELPKYMLETRESVGHLGIFSLKVIPENVRFGPFTGLNLTGLSLRIKGGRFVVSDDKLELLNWMQYINPARNIYEGNLFPFQYEDKLYYCTTRRIKEGEELLVYFGKEYENNLLRNMEMDFVSITKEDVENVFACTFCCLGFRSKEYLTEHKAVCHAEANKMFSVEELVQCPFCKIYLEAKEYSEHHMDYRCEIKDRYCVFLSPEVNDLEVERRSSVRSDARRWKRGIYKCPQCTFKTMYNADFRHHINEHYKVKMYKCGICHRRYKAKESLKAHVLKNHVNDEGKGIQKYNTCENFEANIQNIKERSAQSHEGDKHCQPLKRKFQTRDRCLLKSLIKIKYLNKGKYECANCEFKTYYRTYLDMHMKTKHFMESNYKCAECEFDTNYKGSLERHIKVKHLKISGYKCAQCEYKTNYKSRLRGHVKTKHLKQHDYKCMECEYKTNYKSHLKAHVNVKHLKQCDYKCMDCEYKTNDKSNMRRHVKAKHLKLNEYKCLDCEYQSNLKSNLERHVNAKHLKLRNCKCMECEFKTSCKSVLRGHIKAKHSKQKQKDYKCMDCEYQTNWKSNLEGHVKTRHLKLNEYKCMECEYKANLKSSLELHIKSKHLKLHDYKCTECEYQTNKKSHFERHIKAKHLKLRDYKCMDCEYQTNWKSNLEGHVKTKHLKLNEYKCMECEYKANLKSSLELHIKSKHLKLHDYKCTECEYQTNKKSHFERHVKAKHLKLRDYKCLECGYEMNDKSNLEKHIKSKHLILRDYKCMECEYQTSLKSSLKRHTKRKHLKAVVSQT